MEWEMKQRLIKRVSSVCQSSWGVCRRWTVMEHCRDSQCSQSPLWLKAEVSFLKELGFKAETSLFRLHTASHWKQGMIFIPWGQFLFVFFFLLRTTLLIRAAYWNSFLTLLLIIFFLKTFQNDCFGWGITCFHNYSIWLWIMCAAETIFACTFFFIPLYSDL